MKKLISLLLLLLAAINIDAATLYTPNGKSFQTYDAGRPSYDADWFEEYKENFGPGTLYPNSYVVGSWENGLWEYNCHVFAWNNWQGAERWSSESDMWILGKPSPYSLMWRDYPDVWYTDYDNPIGIVSWIETSNQNEAAIVTYKLGSTITHSARIVGSGTRYISKWGGNPIVKHPPTEVPSFYGSRYKYYKINPAYRPVGTGDPAGRNWGTITNALNGITNGNVICVYCGTYIEDITINKNITLQGSGSPTIRGHTEVSGTSATLKYLYLEPGSTSGTALGIYNGTASVQSCYIEKGPYTGLWGIWCSSSTLQLRYGNVFPTSTSTNTSIFLINAGSSSYIRDCMIKPGTGIAIDGTADGYAQDCDIVTYYRDTGYDINAYFADAGTFDLISNNYGSAQSIYDPYPYNVSGDGWPSGLAKPALMAHSNSDNDDIDDMLVQADSLIAQGKFAEGTDILKSIISIYPDEPAALSALHKLVSYRNERDLEQGNNNYSIENQSDLVGIQRKLADNHPLKLKALEYDINNDVRLGNDDQAITKSFEFSEKYRALECGRRVMLGIADIHHFVTKDEAAEKEIYELFLEKYPDHPLSEYVKLKLQDQPLTPAINPEPEPTFSIYPNPFNLETQIKFRTTETAFVSVDIYNFMGQHIKKVVNRLLPEGSHTFIWDGTNDTDQIIASGLYFCCLRTDKNIYTQKLLLVK